MNISDMSLWGIVLALLLSALSAALLWVIDRRVLGCLLRVRLPRLGGLRRRAPLCWWLAGAGALALVCMVGAGCFVLAFGGRLFWPAACLLLVLQLTAVPRGVTAYRRSLLHTEAHRRYLLANGATRLESVVPSVRRALRAAVLPLAVHRVSPVLPLLPVLFFALLLGGWSLAAAVVAVLLLWLLALALSVAATVLTLWLASCWESAVAKRSSRKL